MPAKGSENVRLGLLKKVSCFLYVQLTYKAGVFVEKWEKKMPAAKQFQSYASFLVKYPGKSQISCPSAHVGSPTYFICSSLPSGHERRAAGGEGAQGGHMKNCHCPFVYEYK